MIGQWALSSIETAPLMVDAPSLSLSLSGTETPGAISRFRDGLKAITPGYTGSLGDG